jgi:hypothetical protein
MGTQSDWFGTIFSLGDLTFADQNNVIGSYYTAGLLGVGNQPDVIYVQSDYAAENW